MSCPELRRETQHLPDMQEENRNCFITDTTDAERKCWSDRDVILHVISLLFGMWFGPTNQKIEKNKKQIVPSHLQFSLSCSYKSALSTTLFNSVIFLSKAYSGSFLWSCEFLWNQHGRLYTCALFGSPVRIPLLFKHRSWTGMKWVRRTLPLLPTSCLWPPPPSPAPGNHSPSPLLLCPPPFPHRKGGLWWERTRKLLGVTDRGGDDSHCRWSGCIENLRTMDEPFSHGISL